MLGALYPHPAHAPGMKKNPAPEKASAGGAETKPF